MEVVESMGMEVAEESPASSLGTFRRRLDECTTDKCD